MRGERGQAGREGQHERTHVTAGIEQRAERQRAEDAGQAEEKDGWGGGVWVHEGSIRTARRSWERAGLSHSDMVPRYSIIDAGGSACGNE